MVEMEYRRLGDSGLVVSVVGLGCNNIGRVLDAEATHTLVRAAIDAGITLFDTADNYGERVGASEELLGAALKGHRDDVVLATKFGMDLRGANGRDFGARGARRYIHRAVEASLRRLDTDHIDLYQLHAPDPATPIEETLSALDDLVRAGKVRYVGSSNLAGWQVADADWTARTRQLTRFVSAQNEYSLLRRTAEEELIPACLRFGVGLLPYYPLRSGLLSGKYRRDVPPGADTRLGKERHAHLHPSAPWETIEALERFAAERGVSLLDVAIGALAARPPVASVIAGATRPEQIRANVAAAAWRPTPDDLTTLDHITA